MLQESVDKGPRWRQITGSLALTSYGAGGDFLKFPHDGDELVFEGHVWEVHFGILAVVSRDESCVLKVLTRQTVDQFGVLERHIDRLMGTQNPKDGKGSPGFWSNLSEVGSD